jgi:hypothetical protein
MIASTAALAAFGRGAESDTEVVRDFFFFFLEISKE